MNRRKIVAICHVHCRGASSNNKEKTSTVVRVDTTYKHRKTPHQIISYRSAKAAAAVAAGSQTTPYATKRHSSEVDARIFYHPIIDMEQKGKRKERGSQNKRTDGRNAHRRLRVSRTTKSPHWSKREKAEVLDRRPKTNESGWLGRRLHVQGNAGGSTNRNGSTQKASSSVHPASLPAGTNRPPSSTRVSPIPMPRSFLPWPPLGLGYPPSGVHLLPLAAFSFA